MSFSGLDRVNFLMTEYKKLQLFYYYSSVAELEVRDEGTSRSSFIIQEIFVVGVGVVVFAILSFCFSISS